jgi:hypothetical protein
MTSSDPQFVTILAFLIAGLFLIQTLFLLVFVDQVNRRVRRAESSLVKASRKISCGLQRTKQHLQQLSWITDRLPVVAREVNNLLEIASEKARWANEIAAHDIHLSTAHLEETGRRIEFALSQFTRQTSKVRKWIRYPAYCISAIIHGAFTGAKAYTRNSRKGQPATHYPDDEIFI